MTNATKINELINGLKEGKIVPYLGPGVLDGVTNKLDNKPIPADSDSLILAMNNGTPMAPRLMYEFPRAAMNLEQKKGRKFIEKFLTATYGEQSYTDSPIHQWLANLELPYIIDINRDTQLQNFYAGRPHTLVVGLARIAGTDYRFRIYQSDGSSYKEIEQTQVDSSLPTLFKPMGTPLPDANYVASDADYVDYITELMGGFAIPTFMKQYRKQKQYLFMGLRMLRDTERMVLSDIIYDADQPTGWVLLPNASEKEQRFCKKKGLEIIDADWNTLLETDQAVSSVA